MLLALSACLYIDDEMHADRIAELSGAGGGGTTDTGDTDPPVTDTSEDTPLPPPEIVDVDPPYGPDAGGTEVTVTGGPFDPDDDLLEVTFGGTPAAIVSVSADTIVVDTPPSKVTGAVDVAVATSGGSDVLMGRFTYWPDATGLAAATGELVWYFLVGPLWGPYDEEYGRATLRFTEPVDYQFYKYWAPELDSCIHLSDGVPDDGLFYDPQVTSIDAVYGAAFMTSPSSSIELPWNTADVRFAQYDLLPEQVTPGETYDLRLEGTFGLPEVELPGVFPVPSAFQITNPAIGGADVPDVVAGQHFEWTQDAEADAFLLQVGMLNADNTAFEEELYCVSRDVGSFTLDPSWWVNWTPDRQIHILAGRYNAGVGVLPWNRGRIEVASQIWYYGIGRSQ
jgi:hypothetical protein